MVNTDTNVYQARMSSFLNGYGLKFLVGQDNPSKGVLLYFKIYVKTLARFIYIWKLFATQALSQTQKNVSEPETGIEPATF